jgi:hypothetical protein
MKRQTYRMPRTLAVISVYCIVIAARTACAQTSTPSDSASLGDRSAIAGAESDSAKTFTPTGCTGKLTIWCRFKAHQRRLEQRRHYNPALCTTFRVVSTATGAGSGFASGALLAPILMLRNVPALAIGGVLGGSTILGALCGYHSQEREPECDRTAGKGTQPTAAPPQAPGW